MRLGWRTLLKGFVGFLAGLAIWSLLTPIYNGFLAHGAELVMRTFERPDITRLNADGEYISVDRIDFSPRSKHPEIPAQDLTFNFLILTALFAAEAKTFTDRNIGGFAVATLILSLTHVLAVVVEVMSIYVGKLGAWSFANYGPVSRNFWGVSHAFYRTVLMYAIAFSLWWICRGRGGDAGKQGVNSSSRRRKKSR